MSKNSRMGHPVFFYSLSAFLVLAALGVISARHPVHAVLSLVAALCALSGLFVLLQAYFVAIVLMLVYAGAILILFLFVVMLVDTTPEHLRQKRNRTFRLAGIAAGLFFLWQIARMVREFVLPSGHSPIPGTISEIGKLLFTTYAIPFEMASLLLFVGIIGAVVLAKKKI